jgi:CubicO group peptidase (beta-lactamase class C family)
MPTPEHFAQSPEAVGVDPEKLEALFERAQREIHEGLLPSCQIAVARNGKLAGMRTFGAVTHEGRPAPATNDTLYVVFSCTKAITSTAAWLLLQEGKLSLDERVADVVPEFGTNGKEQILVEQLFTHTAGFPYAPFPPREWLDRSARLARFGRWRLNFEPGSRMEYHSTSSMWVIAELIERRTGQSYRDFVRQRIAEPLGLDDLYVGLPRGLHGRLADVVNVGEPLSPEALAQMGFPVNPQNEVTEEALEGFNRPEAREAGVPGGGGVMTAGDLALFYQGLLRDGTSHDASARVGGPASARVGGPASARVGGPGSRVWQPDTIARGLEVRTGDLLDPMMRRKANRALGLVIAGESDRVYRGFGHTNSARAFGHGGAGGQIAWADPETGLSFGYCTNGCDRNPLRQGRRTVGLSSRAASCAA